MITTKPLSNTERFIWEQNARTLLPNNAAYFWALAWEWAAGRIGPVTYRGDVWYRNVTMLAESLMTNLGVEWEMYAGCRYISGKRIWWDGRKGQWAQDDYRPA